MRKRNEEFSIKELLNIFIPKLWIIVLVSVLFGSVMWGYAKYLKEDKFTSTTSIHITKKSENLDINVNDLEFATSYLQTYVKLIKYPDFLDKVLIHFKSTDSNYAEHGVEKGWDQLTGKKIVGYVSATTDQDILTVKVTSPDPELSYGLATSIEYMITKSTTPVLAYDPTIVTTHRIQQAEKAAAPDSHRELLHTAIGLVAGAAISMAVIFVVHLFDVTIRDKKKLEENFDIPVLGVIPRFISEEGKSKK